MQYGLTYRGKDIVIVLPDGTGVRLVRCQVPNKAYVRPLDARETAIVNAFMGELPSMTTAAYTRPAYRNVVLEL